MGGDGRGGAFDEGRGRGRRSRVVLAPRRWRQVDGAIRQRWWQTSPVTRKNTKETVAPSRAGMPGDSGATVVTNARATTLTTRGCGCIGHPAFPTPSLEGRATPSIGGRNELAKLGRIVSRERLSTRHPRECAIAHGGGDP